MFPEAVTDLWAPGRKTRLRENPTGPAFLISPSGIWSGFILLNQLEINGVKTVIGGSLDGMQALEFALMDSRIQSAVMIAMGKEHSPWAIGISHAQRSAIIADAKWNNGNYEYDDGPEAGSCKDDGNDNLPHT